MDDFDDVKPTPDGDEEEQGQTAFNPGAASGIPAGFSVLNLPKGMQGFLAQMAGVGKGGDTKLNKAGNPVSKEEIVNLSDAFNPNWDEVLDKVGALKHWYRFGASLCDHDANCTDKTCAVNVSYPLTFCRPRRFLDAMRPYEEEFGMWDDLAEKTKNYTGLWNVKTFGDIEADYRYRVFAHAFDAQLIVESVKRKEQSKLPDV